MTTVTSEIDLKYWVRTYIQDDGVAWVWVFFSSGSVEGDGDFLFRGPGSLTCVRDDASLWVWLLKIQGWKPVTELEITARDWILSLRSRMTRGLWLWGACNSFPCHTQVLTF